MFADKRNSTASIPSALGGASGAKGDFKEGGAHFQRGKLLLHPCLALRGQRAPRLAERFCFDKKSVLCPCFVFLELLAPLLAAGALFKLLADIFGKGKHLCRGCTIFPAQLVNLIKPCFHLLQLAWIGFARLAQVV